MNSSIYSSDLENVTLSDFIIFDAKDLNFISHPFCCYPLIQLGHKILMQILNLVLTLNS